MEGDDNSSVIQNGVVLVENNLIKAVGSKDESQAFQPMPK